MEQSLNEVIDKLEHILKPNEFKTILLRFALYHYKYPPCAGDDGKEREMKATSLACNCDNKLMPYRVIA